MNLCLCLPHIGITGACMCHHSWLYTVLGIESRASHMLVKTLWTEPPKENSFCGNFCGNNYVFCLPNKNNCWEELRFTFLRIPLMSGYFLREDSWIFMFLNSVQEKYHLLHNIWGNSWVLVGKKEQKDKQSWCCYFSPCRRPWQGPWETPGV